MITIPTAPIPTAVRRPAAATPMAEEALRQRIVAAPRTKDAMDPLKGPMSPTTLHLSTE
jgi:hypothetical protein